jgi:uncharacterized membrane protein
MNNFIKTTVLGGVIFLIPFIFVVAILGKALAWTHKLATPLLTHLPIEHFASALVIHLISVLLLVLVCFLAGVAARTPAAAGLVNSLESNVLMKFPPYALLKAKTGSILNPEEQEKLTPVIVRLDDAWQVGFEIEAIEQGKHLVFLPGAPDPWSGSVCIVDAERMTQLDTSVNTVNHIMKRLGKGGAEIIQIPAHSQNEL